MCPQSGNSRSPGIGTGCCSWHFVASCFEPSCTGTADAPKHCSRCHRWDSTTAVDGEAESDNRRR